MSENKAVIEVVNVKKVYQSGDSTITALHPANEQFYKGQLTLIMGPSGSGKTTLLSLVGCVIYPTDGEVRLNGRVVSTLSENQLADVRYVQELRSIPHVEQTYAVVIGSAEARFLDGQTAGVQIIGSDAPQFVIGPTPTKIAEGKLADLNLPDAVSAEFYNAKSWGTDLYLNKEIEAMLDQKKKLWQAQYDLLQKLVD